MDIYRTIAVPRESDGVYVVFMAVLALLAVVSLISLHLSCNVELNFQCLLTVCAFILTFAGLAIVWGRTAMIIPIPVNMGVNVPYRLKRPPRD